MKKKNLTITAVAFLALNIVFNIAYDLYYTFGYEYGLVKQNTGFYSLLQIVPMFFTIVTTVLLIVGVLKQKKVFFCIYYAYNIFHSIVVNIPAIISGLEYKPRLIDNILSGLSNTTFNIFMFIFILLLFSRKENKGYVTRNLKRNDLTITTVTFLALNTVFKLAYDAYNLYYTNSLVFDPGFKQIVHWIFTIITAVLLIIGIIKQKKLYFCIYYAYNILYTFAFMISTIVNNASDESRHTFIPLNIFSSLISITFTVFMLIFVLIAFSWKGKTEYVTQDDNIPIVNNTEFNADILIEYKQLLDSGAITQEEFDAKKALFFK